jgi:hypothetical protein
LIKFDRFVSTKKVLGIADGYLGPRALRDVFGGRVLEGERDNCCLKISGATLIEAPKQSQQPLFCDLAAKYWLQFRCTFHRP